ncbi:fibro-slime domain-containing protein [Subdoligranulum variabile]|uniref:DUF7601 domain-containing protein n=1 Tax=Subdoligranulum variabile TaxID=214851 RepID=UPI0026EFD873|nr:fibro-slime domain-containing protein [Subdoligranulum variabile]
MKKRVLSALLALCLTLSLAGAAFAENEPSGDSSSAVSQAVSSVESEPQTQNETVSSGSASGEDQTAAKTESTPAPTETPAASDVAEEEPESTPEPEATAEPDATPAPTEDPVADVTENEESDGSVEYTAALETDDQTLNVIVTAPEGAFAEGVEPQLSVTMLTTEDELNDVANKLTDAEVQYDGFTALDITFTDKATGEEIEPVQQVSVRIELPQTIVDSGIDLNTLAVQHLEEDENGNVNVAEVATLDNGITLSEEAAAAANEAAGVAPMSDMPAEEAAAGDAAETPAAVAEFSVDGFSSFVITWQGSGNQGDGTATVVLWDETNNKELTVSGLPETVNLTDGLVYTADQLQQVIDSVTVDGYTYSSTTVGYYNRWRSYTEAEDHFGNVKAEFYDIFISKGWRYTVNDEFWPHDNVVIRVNYSKPLSMFRGEDTKDLIDIDLYNYTHAQNSSGGSNDINFVQNAQGGFDFRPFQFSYDPNSENHGNYNNRDNRYSTSVTQGIVNNDLGADGYPTLVNGDSSLAYLFGDADVPADAVEGKKIYNDVNYLFQIDDNGYYYYDSSRNFATVMLDENGQPYQENEQHTNDVWLYGDEENGVTYPNQAFMPFNTLTGNKNNPSINGTDYHFGMTVGFEFLMPEGGQVKDANGEDQDMIFSFAGDDDVWVFIDGKLVLDIGGIHGSEDGSINFASGKVEVDGVQDQNIWTLLGYDSMSAWREAWTLETHELKFFYFERGSGSSNCKIQFNMPMIPADSVAVTKRVAGAETNPDQEYTLKFIPAEGTDVTQITVGTSNNGGDLLFANGSDGTFTLKGGETKYINNIPAGTDYQIQEISVPQDVMVVAIDGRTATIDANRTASLSDDPATVDEDESLFSSEKDRGVVVTNTYAPEDFEGITVYKTAEEHTDDPSQYDLTLSVTGDTGSIDDQLKMDVLFILDDSNSMTNNEDVPVFDDNGNEIDRITRREAANNAIRTLVTELEGNGALDVQYGLIRFSGYMDKGTYNDAASALSNQKNEIYWTGNASDLIGSQNYWGDWSGGVLPTENGTEGGGTNYEAGFVKAKDALNSEQKRDDAETVVIFISDGMPGYYYAQKGGERYDGYSYNEGRTIGLGSPNHYDSDGEAIKRAITACQSLDMDYFYTVGVADATSLGALNDLVAKGAPSHVDGSTKDAYMATDMDNLQQAFEDIQNNITSFACSNVVMHDTLSSNVAALVPDSIQFRVFIEERNSQSATGYSEISGMTQNVGNNEAATFNTLDDEDGNATFQITPSLAADGKTITVTFSNNYQLEPGYRYSVEIVITPSDSAKENAPTDPDNYPDNAEAGTGTYALQKGFYSNNNDEAYVEYVIESDQIGGSDIEDVKYFPEPVIRVPAPTTGDLTITKAVEWKNSSEMTDTGSTLFHFTITTTTNVTEGQPDGGYSILVNGEESQDKANFTFSDGLYSAAVSVSGEGSVEIKDLPLDTYMVEETDAPDIGDFYCASKQYGDNTTATNASLTLDEDHTERSVTVTNTYAKYRTVTVIKNVTGEMGDTSRFFEFTAQIGTTDVSQENIQTVQEETAQVTDDGAFKLKDDGSVTIAKVRQDATLTISETSVANEGYTTKHTIGGNTLQSNVATVTPEMLGANDVTVSFENYRGIVAPTGLEDNHTKPFGLMVGVAVMAGLALAGGTVVRRRRRWME